ncbi:hypothetical protein GGI12_005043 [Dipsacomyces acuminosporus]|nr:hypothetical protein GGI12_005043 [Dipsacomyces acuminosporus]
MAAPTTFQLEPIERIRENLKVLQYIFLFKDPTETSDTQPPLSFERFRSSFEKLLEHYPILQGHIDTSAGARTIRVSEDDLKKQLFTGHTDNDLSAESFQEVRYHRELWPGAIRKLITDGITKDPNKLCSAIVVRLANGWLATLGVSHVLADTAGVSILLEQWSSLSKDGKLKRGVNFDRVSFWNKLTNPATPGIHPFYTLVSEVDATGVKLPAGKKPRGIVTRLVYGGKQTFECILHVPRHKIDQISSDFNSKDSGEKPIHGVQILYAILWQRYVVAARKAHQTPVSDNEKTFMNIIHNGRYLVDGCADYVGTCTCPMPIGIDSKEIASKPVIELAKYVKSRIRTCTPGIAAHYAKERADIESNIFLFNAMLINKPESKLILSNVSRLPFFDIDFGAGTPEFALLGNIEVNELSTWMPLKDGGVDIYLGIEEDVLEALASDELFTEYIQIVKL